MYDKAPFLLVVSYKILSPLYFILIYHTICIRPCGSKYDKKIENIAVSGRYVANFHNSKKYF